MTPESLEPGAKKQMTGSFMIFEAENIEQVRKIIESDAYYTGDVWDPKKIVITPFMLGIPEMMHKSG